MMLCNGVYVMVNQVIDGTKSFKTVRRISRLQKLYGTKIWNLFGSRLRVYMMVNQVINGEDS